MKYVIIQKKFLTNSRHVELHDKLTTLNSTFYSQTIAMTMFENYMKDVRPGESVSLEVINDDHPVEEV